MQPEPPIRRSYDRNGFENEERQNQLINYLHDQELEEERRKRWELLLPRILSLRNSGRQGEKRVISEVREGVCDQLRHKVWPLLIQEPLMRFEECRDRCENKEVNLDLERTFPTHKEAKALEQRMKVVLNALVVALPEVGSNTGMNFIVGTILLRLSEEDAFKVAFHIFHWEKQEELLRDLNVIHQQLYALDRSDKKALPAAFRVAARPRSGVHHLRLFLVHHAILQLPPRLLLLSHNRVLPALRYSLRHSGQKILYRVALQILKWKKKRLKKRKNVEDLVEELKNYDEFNEGNVDSFFHEMFEIQLSREQIRKYKQDFHAKSPKKEKSPRSPQQHKG